MPALIISPLLTTFNKKKSSGDVPNKMLGNYSFSSGLCEGNMLKGVAVGLVMLQYI